MNKLQKHLKTYFRQSQVKIKKAFRNQGKPELSLQKPNLKHLKRLEASAKAYFYINLNKSLRAIVHRLTPMFLRYGENVVPSQGWIAGKTDYSLRTTHGALKDLDQLKIIKKKSRGWRAVDVENKVFVSNTCAYSLDEGVVSDLKFIAKYDSSSTRLIKKIIEAIPAMHKLFMSFCVLSSLFLNNSYLRNTNKYIRREEITIFGQDNYEIAQIYKNKEILPTTTLTTHTSIVSVLEETHPGNIFYESYPYNKKYIEDLSHLKLNNLKRGNMDIRFCDKSQYAKLGYEDQKIAERYYNGRKTYGTVFDYEERLKALGKSKMIWKPPVNNNKLTNEQVDIIKSYAIEHIQYVKDKLKSYPENKNNFQWIHDILKSRHKMNSSQLKNLLKDNGFNHNHISNDQYKTSHERKGYPYQPYKPQKVEQPCEPSPIDNTEVNENFRALIGDEAFLGYSQRAGLFEKEDINE